jgi:hypothetical protein
MICFICGEIIEDDEDLVETEDGAAHSGCGGLDIDSSEIDKAEEKNHEQHDEEVYDW